MNKRSTLAVASVLLSLLAFGTPASAEPYHGGLTCAMAAASVDGGHTWNGVITGGPWKTESPDHLVSMQCYLQQWTGEQWETIAAVDSPLLPWVTVAPPLPVEFVTTPWGMSARSLLGGTLQMCTQVTIYPDPMQPPYVELVDYDHDPSNGSQCAPPSHADTALVDMTFVPHNLDGEVYCWWLDRREPVPEEVPDAGCVPPL